MDEEQQSEEIGQEEQQSEEIGEQEQQSEEVDEQEQSAEDSYGDEPSSEEMLGMDLDPDRSVSSEESNTGTSDKEKKDHPGPSQDPGDDAGEGGF